MAAPIDIVLSRYAADRVYEGKREQMVGLLQRKYGYAKEKAEQELAAAKDMDPQQYEHLQSLVRYSGVQLAVKRRRR